MCSLEFYHTYITGQGSHHLSLEVIQIWTPDPQTVDPDPQTVDPDSQQRLQINTGSTLVEMCALYITEA